MIRDRETRLWKTIYTTDSGACYRRLTRETRPIIVFDHSIYEHIDSWPLLRAYTSKVLAEARLFTPQDIQLDPVTKEEYIESGWQELEKIAPEGWMSASLLQLSDKQENKEDEAPERARLEQQALQQREEKAFKSPKHLPRIWIHHKTKIRGALGCLFLLGLMGPGIGFMYLAISSQFLPVPVALCAAIVAASVLLVFGAIRDHRDDRERIKSIRSRLGQRS